MNNLKIGFIGYGRHAQANLYPSIRHLGYKISAVATTHQESATKCGDDYSISHCYTNHLDMLKKELLDVVFICTKPEQQVQLVKDSLNAGVHVFVEKNLGFSSAEAEEIKVLSDKVGKKVMVGFMKRFAPVYLKLKEIIDDGEFGKVISLSQTFTSRNFVSSSKEYLLFAAIHFIDLIRFYVGEISKVKGFETIEGDSMSQTFSLKSVSGASISLSYSASPSWSSGVQEITITGTNGYAKTSGISNLKYHFNETKPNTPGWQTVEEKEIQLNTMLTTGGGGVQNLYLNGFIGEVDYFLKSINDNLSPINDATENVKTMKLYDMLVNCLDKK
ncbi:Gfo/Idh/MocA family oxidoreductase [Candidatus Shapirobacteria bacterium]|nr:Gfo/Idh/MocA family oxidoreductase [Candidatus Shapirobacteria bacterium]